MRVGVQSGPAMYILNNKITYEINRNRTFTDFWGDNERVQ